MGCDIHFVVQSRERRGPWVLEPGIQFHDRNYAAFGILAGVRSDTFPPISEPKGLPTDFHVTLEKDEHGYERETPDTGDHSKTWLSLEEILDYDWAQVRNLSGFVDARQFKDWDWVRDWEETYDRRSFANYPKGYCAGVGGGKVRIVSNEEMRAYVKENGERLLRRPESEWEQPVHRYTRVEWPVLASVAAGRFWQVTVPQMVAVQRKGREVRAVFGFDS